MRTVERHHDRVGAASLGSLQVAGRAPTDEDPELVLLHGIPTGAELWRDVLAELGAAGRRAVAPDLPGYGETAVPPRVDHSLAGAAELVAAWLRQRGGPPVWLVGHDLGGLVAQLLAVRHADLVGRVTVGDCPVGDTWPVVPLRLLRAVARLGLYDAPAAAWVGAGPLGRAVIRRGFAHTGRVEDETLDRVFLDRKIRSGAGRRAFARHLRSLDPRQTAGVEHELGAIRAPAQLIWAADDRFLPFATVGVRLRDALPEPHVTVIEGAGHLLPLERPVEYVDALLAWTP